MTSERNYLQELAQGAPQGLPPALSTEPAGAIVNGCGESVSPTVLKELQSYLEARMEIHQKSLDDRLALNQRQQELILSQQVGQALTTLVPDIVEHTLSKARATQAIAPAPTTAPGQSPHAELIMVLVAGAIVALMAGMMGWVATRNPSAQTTDQNKLLGQQIQQQNQTIRDLAAEAGKAQCRVFCF